MCLSRVFCRLPALGEDMLGRRAMVLQDHQTGRYFPALQARGWSLKPGEPSASLEKRFDFETEDRLASWTTEMLAYMQRAKVRSSWFYASRDEMTRCSTMRG